MLSYHLLLLSEMLKHSKKKLQLTEPDINITFNIYTMVFFQLHKRQYVLIENMQVDGMLTHIFSCHTDHLNVLLVITFHNKFKAIAPGILTAAFI